MKERIRSPKCIRCKEDTWRVGKIFDFNVYICFHCELVIKTARSADMKHLVDKLTLITSEILNENTKSLIDKLTEIDSRILNMKQSLNNHRWSRLMPRRTTKIINSLDEHLTDIHNELCLLHASHIK